MATQNVEPLGIRSAKPAGDRPLPPPADGASEQRRTEQPEIDLNLATIWRIVRRWRWLIIGAFATGIAVAVIVTLLTTPVYNSESTLEVNPPSVEVMDNEDAAPVAPADRAYIATQFGLLQSRSLAERVSQDLNLAGNEAFAPQEVDRGLREDLAITKLMENLQIQEMDESRLLRISYFDEDPQLAARIVNGFGEAFIATSLERRYEASAYARNFLEDQIARIRGDLERSERQLIGYAQQQGIISGQGEDEVTDSASLQRTTLAQLNEQLATTTAERIAAEGRYNEALRNPVTQAQQDDTALLRNQRAELAADYQDKLRLFKPDYPEMVQIRARIDAFDEQIAAASQTARQARTGQFLEDFRSARVTENELRQQVNALKSQVLDLRGSSVQYNILQREVDTNRSLYDALLQRYKEVGVAGGIGNSQVSIVDRGDVPSEPDKPDLPLNLAIGALVGLLAGIGLAMALEFVSDTIKSPDDVRDRLGLGYLGGIPPSKTTRLIEELENQASPLAEAYFSTASSLQFTSEDGVPRVLLLSSSRPGEGKSTTSWALANQFAQLGRSVLLVDGDMRKPTFVTGHEKESGLSTLLSSRDALARHVAATGMDNLTILPCGPKPPNPAELLSSPRLREMLAEARSLFDVVIVDGPPVLGLADSPILSRVCDGTLIVIEAGKTRTTAVIEALNRIRQADGNITGAILTRYRQDSASYGYNYDAYSYSSAENRGRQIHVPGRPA